MSLAVSDGECCRVPGCGHACVGYIQVGSKGRREVYVGHPAGLNQIPVCAEHLYVGGPVSPPRAAHLAVRGHQTAPVT